MKLLCIGAGSIGRRHIANAAALGCQVVAADPFAAPVPGVLWYPDWRRALADHGDAGGVIIASPTAHHLEQLMEAAHAGIPAYVEKPFLSAADYRQLAVEHLLPTLPLYARHVCGFQYFFHPHMPQVADLARRHGELAFSGQDALLERYGPNVGEIMVAHPLATALRYLGAAQSAALVSDGVRLRGSVTHLAGVSYYDFDMGAGPRQSWVRAARRKVELGACDSMYSDCLAAWLRWVAGGPSDARLSDLALGLEVSRILSEVLLTESAR